MRVMNAGMYGRLGSGTFIAVILPLLGSKSNSRIGALKTPPNVRFEVAVVLAVLFRVIWVGLSTLAIREPELRAAPEAPPPTCSPAVEGTVTIAEPAVVELDRTMGLGPASAPIITWPLGSSAAGASSAPKLALLMVPPGPMREASISGPAAQLLVDGV